MRRRDQAASTPAHAPRPGTMHGAAPYNRSSARRASAACTPKHGLGASPQCRLRQAPLTTSAVPAPASSAARTTAWMCLCGISSIFIVPGVSVSATPTPYTQAPPSGLGQLSAGSVAHTSGAGQWPPHPQQRAPRHVWPPLGCPTWSLQRLWRVSSAAATPSVPPPVKSPCAIAGGEARQCTCAGFLFFRETRAGHARSQWNMPAAQGPLIAPNFATVHHRVPELGNRVLAARLRQQQCH